MFGKIIASVVEGVIDTVELGTAVVTDAAKAPVRLFDLSVGEDVSFLEDTKEKIQDIKDRD